MEHYTPVPDDAPMSPPGEDIEILLVDFQDEVPSSPLPQLEEDYMVEEAFEGFEDEEDVDDLPLPPSPEV